MNLTYNKTSGHIKRDGAVVGRVEPGGKGQPGYVATMYIPGRPISYRDDDLAKLLAAVRRRFEKSIALTAASGKARPAKKKG